MKIVKMVSRGSTQDIKSHLYRFQSPRNSNRWGECQFVFDPFEENYDWLVVLDEVPRILPSKTEELKCPKEHTILVTIEPSSIVKFGKHFTHQFHYVITNHSEKELPHPNAIRSQTGIYWLYGKDFDRLERETFLPKRKLISTICSDKRSGNALYKQRYDFTKVLEEKIKEVDRYGRGFKFVKHKYEAIDDYKFHVVVENQISEHLWSEKLADAFLGYSVPIYCGCPNIYDYFPKESLITIDIYDVEGSIKKIKNIISTPGEYEKRLEAVREARRRIMYEYNLLAMIENIVKNSKEYKFTPGMKIVSRRKLRSKHIEEFTSYCGFRIKNFLKKQRDKIL